MRKGIHYENADYMSRLWTQPKEAELVDDFPDEQLFQMTSSRDSRYANLYRCLLTLQWPKEMDAQQHTVFIHKARPYQIQQGVLFKPLPDDRLCHCLETSKVVRVVTAMHAEDVEGHYATKNTLAKILNAGY